MDNPTDYELTYSKLKSGAVISTHDKDQIERTFWGPLEKQSYYSLLSYALLFPCDLAGLKRYQENFKKLYDTGIDLEKFDDDVSAIILAFCNYWDSTYFLENELKQALEDWAWDERADTCIRAAGYFSHWTNTTQSKERLAYLKDTVLHRYDEADEVEKSVIADSIISAIFGARFLSRSVRETYREKESLANLSFEDIATR